MDPRRVIDCGSPAFPLELNPGDRLDGHSQYFFGQIPGSSVKHRCVRGSHKLTFILGCVTFILHVLKLKGLNI